MIPTSQKYGFEGLLSYFDSMWQLFRNIPRICTYFKLNFMIIVTYFSLFLEEEVENKHFYSKMEVLSPEKRKIFAFNNIFTSVFLILIVLYLSIVNELYNVGKYNKFWLIMIISIFEVIKYIIYFVTQKKNLKTAELKHHKIINIIKSVVTISAMVGIYYIIAVLFGAPFMTHQEENLMFSLILTVLTVLPICLHCGHDAAIQLLLSITNYDGNELLNKFLFQIRSVFVGAWLGLL